MGVAGINPDVAGGLGAARGADPEGGIRGALSGPGPWAGTNCKDGDAGTAGPAVSDEERGADSGTGLCPYVLQHSRTRVTRGTAAALRPTERLLMDEAPCIDKVVNRIRAAFLISLDGSGGRRLMLRCSAPKCAKGGFWSPSEAGDRRSGKREIKLPLWREG